MGDWDIIRSELDAADHEQRVISDLAARIIATQFYDSQSSPLYALSSTGTITDDCVADIRSAVGDTSNPDEQRALEALIAYCAHRADKGPRRHWASLRW